MQFFNPLMLIGLVAAAIPILLHLLNVRKLRTIEFSTLRFLQELQRSQVRRLKVEQWLLLVLRTLLVVLAVLAFARPVIPTSVPVLGGQVRSSVVIVLDNSPSMDARDSRGNRFRWAVRQAMQILDALKSGDEVAVVTASALLQSKRIELTSAIGAVRDELQALPLAYGHVPLDQLLEVAQATLATAQNAHRELYIISDFQTNLFRWNDSLALSLPAERVVVVPAADGTTLDQLDLGIDSVGVVTRIVEPGKPVEVTVRVRNNSARDANGAVVRMRFNGEHVAQRAFDLSAGQVRTLSLLAPAPASGFVAGSIEVEPDACESDNRRLFALVVPPMPNVLIVGRPDATVYLEAALTAIGQRQAPRVRVVEPAQLSGLALDGYDVLILTEPLSRSGLEQIRAYLNAGRGNVLLFASAHASAGEQQQFAADLGIGPLVALPPRTNSFYELRGADEQHPLFAGVFRAERGAVTTLESPAIEQALASTAGVALIGIEGGAFASEHIVGKRRVMYCAVPPTLEWSAFPTSGLFPVFVVRSVLYLAATESVGADFAVGERCRVELSPRAGSGDAFRLRDATGAESLVGAVRFAGTVVVDVGRPLLPGCMAILPQSDPEPIAALAINVPPSEAQLSFVPPDRVVSYIAQRVGKEDVELATAEASIGALVARERQRAELWPWLIGAALACAVGEMIIAAGAARRMAP